jgi:hypothetical protein
LKKSELSVAEQKYGVAPIPGPSVTYQPDVIVVGGGGDAIRAQSSNGFIWTIDAKAPRADELAPGKIFFMTNRAVGRVLDVRKNGGDLIVAVGPVDIVEVVRDADIKISMPIDFGEAIPYTSADLPAQSIPARPLMARFADDDAGPAIRRVAYSDSSAWRTGGSDSPRVLRTADPKAIPLHFNVVPFAGTSGIGLRATSQVPGLTLSAQSMVHLAAPRLDAELKIDGGKVSVATVELTGAAGLLMKFEASTDVGMSANVNEIITPDTDFSIPVFVLGELPFAVTLRHAFIIKTGFGVKNTTLRATGDYTFNGSFKIGYTGGKWGVAGPMGFHANQSLLQTTKGRSAAVSGLDMTDQLKVIVGIGTHGFAAGPYFAFNSTVGISRTSDIQMLNCRAATLYVSLLGGVGYVIPQAVTKAINFILAQLNIKYRIDGEGGFSTDPKVVINSSNTAPPSDACKE